MTPRAPRRALDAKTLYFAALDIFRERNRQVLPQLQLQHGKCERWLSREFAVAMNGALTGSLGPTSMQTYADCELGYADITVWRPPGKEPLALYEVKALYRRDPLVGIVKRARSQLESGPLAVAENRIGLFFAVFVNKGTWRSQSAKEFQDAARDAVRTEFTSDHDIRMTRLVPPTEIVYGDASWWTSSWVTWGRPT